MSLEFARALVVVIILGIPISTVLAIIHVAFSEQLLRWMGGPKNDR